MFNTAVTAMPSSTPCIGISAGRKLQSHLNINWFYPGLSVQFAAVAGQYSEHKRELLRTHASQIPIFEGIQKG